MLLQSTVNRQFCFLNDQLVRWRSPGRVSTEMLADCIRTHRILLSLTVKVGTVMVIKCELCARLWREYAALKARHAKLDRLLQTALADQDDAKACELAPKVETALRLRL